MKYKVCVAVVDNDFVDIPAAGRILGFERSPPTGTAAPGEIQSYKMLIWYLLEVS